MPRGGPRQGTPGVGYSNRTDLAADRAPTPQGQVDPTAAGGQTAPPQQQFTRPDDVPKLTDPTADSRPVMSGAPIGAGLGVEALGSLPQPRDNTLAILRDLYGKTGSEHIRRLIAQQQLMSP